jgi:GT2 family glycosyltransferase
VPIFNGTSYLPAFFDSLDRALPEGSELILVDDASTERVWETVPDFSGANRVVRLQNKRNVGYATTVNRGFAAATEDVVVVLNTDLVLQPDCINAMVELIQREDRVGIVGSKLVYPTTGLVQHVGIAFGQSTRTHVYRHLPPSHPLCEKTREVQVSTGATTAMTRKVLAHLGPLDEAYFNCNEDIDHGLRARKAGLRNFVCGASVAHHWESKSGPSRFARQKSSEAMFWSRWGNSHNVDLGRFVDEALDHVLDEHPHLEEVPFQVLDLSRGPDQAILVERLAARWPGIDSRVLHFRQMNNRSDRLWLQLLLPHWMQVEAISFAYVVDSHRELEENELWFESRRRTVRDELVLDLSGTVLHTSELPRLGATHPRVTKIAQ